MPEQKKRGRPPKNKPVETNTEKTNEYCSLNGSYLSSNLWFGLNVFDMYSPELLTKIIEDPMANNQDLRQMSMKLYSTNGTCTNTIDYMTAMPTLDRVIVTHGKNKTKKKQNKELFESTLRTIKDKEIVRDALFKGMLEGTAFYYFETTTRPLSNKKFLNDFDVQSISEINEINEMGVNASVISLPTDYTRIVGIKNNSYLIAFNLDYFTDSNGESAEKKLRKYPKEIRDAYQEKGKNSSKNGNWVILDNTKTIVHKIRSKRDEPWGRPLVLAAIQDILYSDYFTNTKRNVLDEVNNKFLWMELPAGEKKGSCSLTQAQQKDQHEKVKNAVMTKNSKGGTSFVTVASGTKISALDVSNTEIFDSKNEADLSDKVALDLGFAASLLNGVSTGNYAGQQSNLELVTAQIFTWIEQIENELNKCISANIIKDNKNWCECRYLPITHVNKQTMIQSVKDLYLQGAGSILLWSSAVGIPPEVFISLLEFEKEEKYDERFKPHQTSFTLSKNDGNDKGGRPVTDNPTEKTLAGRANGGNDLPSPSDNK